MLPYMALFPLPNLWRWDGHTSLIVCRGAAPAEPGAVSPSWTKEKPACSLCSSFSTQFHCINLFLHYLTNKLRQSHLRSGSPVPQLCSAARGGKGGLFPLCCSVRSLLKFRGPHTCGSPSLIVEPELPAAGAPVREGDPCPFVRSRSLITEPFPFWFLRATHEVQPSHEWERHHLRPAHPAVSPTGSGAGAGGAFLLVYSVRVSSCCGVNLPASALCLSSAGSAPTAAGPSGCGSVEE